MLLQLVNRAQPLVQHLNQLTPLHPERLYSELVALAGEFSGVYPRESPGGWQLIGHTDAALWDIERDPPALLAAGMWVGFRAVEK